MLASGGCETFDIGFVNDGDGGGGWGDDGGGRGLEGMRAVLVVAVEVKAVVVTGVTACPSP